MKLKLVNDFDLRLFVIIPTITLEDFGGGLHVVLRFGPFSYTIMKDKTAEDAHKDFLERMRQLP